MKNINQQIVDTAYEFLGQEEIRGNMGFKDDRFQGLMKATGWKPSQAWCAYFAELVWRMAYAKQNSLIEAEVEKIFSAGAVKTYNNFKKNGKYVVCRTPVKGAVVIWQYYRNGKPHWSGHAGIVIKYTEKSFDTIEGNTNDDGVREGYEVARRIRHYNFDDTSGLVLLGFIHPIEP